MSNFIMDYSKKQTMQISNDAFCYLYYGEQPLDEDNLEEAEEVSAMFPYGFYIEEDWKTVENSDLIEATFVPFVKDEIDYDEYEELTKYIQQQIKWLDANTIRVWWYNTETGARELRGDFNVYTNQCGLKCFQTGDYTIGKGSLFFLKHFKKKGN